MERKREKRKEKKGNSRFCFFPVFACFSGFLSSNFSFYEFELSSNFSFYEFELSSNFSFYEFELSSNLCLLWI
jgi:hypothetical protein